MKYMLISVAWRVPTTLLPLVFALQVTCITLNAKETFGSHSHLKNTFSTTGKELKSSEKISKEEKEKRKATFALGQSQENTRYYTH